MSAFHVRFPCPHSMSIPPPGVAAPTIKMVLARADEVEAARAEMLKAVEAMPPDTPPDARVADTRGALVRCIGEATKRTSQEGKAKRAAAEKGLQAKESEVALAASALITGAAEVTNLSKTAEANVGLALEEDQGVMQKEEAVAAAVKQGAAAAAAAAAEQTKTPERADAPPKWWAPVVVCADLRLAPRAQLAGWRACSAAHVRGARVCRRRCSRRSRRARPSAP